MPSTFSTNLKIELMATGENSGTWGTVTNTNLGTALEQAVVGYGNPNYSSDANLTIALTDSNAAQAARALVLNVTSSVSLTGTRELVVPTIQKQYIVQNNTTGSQSITVKTSAGTGVTIPNGKKMHVYVNGTDVVQMDDFALIFNVDNLTLDGNTLSSTNTNGNIVIAPNGTGDVQLDADTIRVGDSNANATITTNGTGDLILNTNAGTNSGSITIEDGVNGNIIIAPNGTGQVQITNAALDLTTIEVSNINAKDGTAAITIADSTGAVGISTAVTMSATTQNIALGTSQTTGTWTAGGASQTGALTLDQSTKTHTLNLGTGATESGLTKTVNIGTGGVSTSTTAINIGSANGTTTTLNGTVTAATLNSTTIDTTNIEVTNIKAKDGSASATIADSTGVMTIASSVLTTTDINGGTIDGTTIGGSTAAAGTFTTATATTGNITTVNATTVDTTNLEVTNIKAKDGTAALSIADSTGVVSVSANPVLSGGTANGVLYLNASKVATSGSALVFDGTNLGVGTASPSGRLHVANTGTAGTTADNLAVYFSSTNRNANVYILAKNTEGSNLNFGDGDNSSVGRISYDHASNYMAFDTSSSEKLRITSGGQVNIGGNFTSTNNTLQVTGNAAIGYTTAAPTTGLIVAGNVGIGTDIPGVKLDVSGQARALEVGTGSGDGGLIGATAAQNGNAGVLFQTNSASRWNLTTQGTNGANLRFYNYALASNVATFDSSGNLGLGVTPSAWRTSEYKAVQVGNGASFYGRVTAGDEDKAGFSANAFFDQTDNRWEYIATDSASRYDQIGGGHYWFTAASGTAGNQISFGDAKMTLDASGNLGIGTTSISARLEVQAVGVMARFKTGAANDGRVEWAYNTTDVGYVGTGSSTTFEIAARFGNALILGAGGAEKARITSGGYFKASNTGTYVSSTGGYHEFLTNSTADFAINVRSTASATGNFGINITYPNRTPNNTGNVFFACVDSTATRAEIRSNGGLANYQSNNVDLSDIRTKTDINPLASYWNKIAALEIVSYKYKDQTHDDLNIGVIAQQVEQVAPEFVDPDGFGETPEDGVPLKTIYNKDLTFAAIKALQEAMARIEKLEAEVAALKGV